jgi:outer membrane protein assembly factor BamB
MKTRTAIVATFVVLLTAEVRLSLAQVEADDKRITPGTPEHIIKQRAKQEGLPLWQIPLGQVHADEMRLIAPGKLLVGLKKSTSELPNQECLLVDLETGAVLWRHPRSGKGDYFPLLVLDQAILFQIVEGDEQSLLHIDLATGAKRWQIAIPGENVRLQPVPSAGRILVDKRDRKKVELFALNLADGKTLWTREFTLNIQGNPLLAPFVEGEAVWHFFDGTERITIRDGSSLWSRPDLRLSESDPPPQLVDETLYLAQNKTLLALDAATGATRWSKSMSMFPTNIYPSSKYILVRGERPYEDSAGRFSFKLPQGWKLDEEVSPAVYRFKDDFTGAFVLVSYHDSNADLETTFDIMKSAMKNLAEGSPQRQSEVETTVDGHPARWAEYAFKIKKDNEKVPLTAHVGAVVNNGIGAGFFAAVPAQFHERVKKEIMEAFETLQLGQKLSVAQTWQQRSAVSGSGSFQITACSRRDGRFLWGFCTSQPTLSNFVELGERLYVATASSLYALETATGHQAWVSEVTDTGRGFPVRLRAYDDKVVFISELVIAAYNPTDGQKIYKHGVTPISEESSLAGLDNSIPQFEVMHAAASSLKPETSNILSNYYSAQSRNYQNLANQYRRQGEYLRSQGRDPSVANLQSQMARDEAKSQATLAFVHSLLELGATLHQLFRISAVKAYYGDILARQRLFRRSIISAYAMAEVGDFVYRPHRQFGFSGDADFTTLTIVHLASGQRRTTMLSPTYLGYGLWNLVDEEKGVVYHHGVGLDPSRYEYGGEENVGIYGKVRTLNTFLIAAPIKLPTQGE